MANIQKISAALKLTNTKMENLRKAFEDLQSHSSSFSLPSSFSLSWPDLDSHFTSLQSTLENKFNNLVQSQEKPQSPSPITVKNFSEPATTVMKSLCEEMNGLGLRQYLVELAKERSAVRSYLSDALRCAPDAPAIVLDAMDGFYVPDSKGDNDKELCSIRSWCLILLEELRAVEAAEIKPEVRERANNLAVEWKGKACLDGTNPFESLGFLNLLVSYGLVGGFDMDELIEFAVAASSKYSQTLKVCQNLGFGDRISDLIQKFISKGKHLPAAKFISEFGLAGKFPPVPLLKDYVKESKKLAENVRNDPKSNNKSMIGATMKEISSLQSVIKYIEDHKLESEYPKENLVKRIGKLKKLKVIWKESRLQKKKKPQDSGSKQPRKTAPAGPAAAPSRQSRRRKRKSQEDGGSKRPRTDAPAGPAATPSSVAAQRTIALPLQQPHVPPVGLLPEHPGLYSGLPARPYDLAAPTPATGLTPAVHPYGSTPAVPPYRGSPAGLYGFTGSPMGSSGNVTPLASAYSVRPVAYSVYGLPPQYRHPYYYPQ